MERNPAALRVWGFRGRSTTLDFVHVQDELRLETTPFQTLVAFVVTFIHIDPRSDWPSLLIMIVYLPISRPPQVNGASVVDGGCVSGIMGPGDRGSERKEARQTLLRSF